MDAVNIILNATEPNITRRGGLELMDPDGEATGPMPPLQITSYKRGRLRHPGPLPSPRTLRPKPSRLRSSFIRLRSAFQNSHGPLGR